MNHDLQIIKDKYGEKMMQLCRTLFPTLLEEKGLLSRLMQESFAPNKLLYDHITEKYLERLYHDDPWLEKDNIENFKDYIFSIANLPPKKTVETTKTPKELLAEAGYELYKCETEEDIKKFKKYYKKGEELCTFKDERLKKCIVFFAVKKNVDQINRKDFEQPTREDAYGTSVISIQFSKGNLNTLSIKNRYNHTVSDPDATFNNNLENIIPGLTSAFEKEYQLNINQAKARDCKLKGFVLANDGKYYKYNYEINNVYYCPNNIIIDNFIVKNYPKFTYLVIDYFVIDLETETISLYDNSIMDSFTDGIWNIKKISIIKKENNKKNIIIETHTQNIIEIEIDKNNKITGYKNEKLTKADEGFLRYNRSLTSLSLPNLKKASDYFLYMNNSLQSLSLPKLKEVGYGFLSSDSYMEIFEAPKLRFVNSPYPLNILDKMTTKQPIFNLAIRDFYENTYEKICETLSIYKRPRLFRDEDRYIIKAKRARKEITKKIKQLISSAYKYKEKEEKRRKK